MLYFTLLCSVLFNCILLKFNFFIALFAATSHLIIPAIEPNNHCNLNRHTNTVTRTRTHNNTFSVPHTGVGYVGSEDGTQLSHFMRENENSMSVVLLDEFDHCDSETWEAFYHVFDEGKSLF
jgi:hypothetical protein